MSYTNKLKLIITRGCRSDYGLSDPLIKRIEKDPFFELKTLQLIPANFIESYKLTETMINDFKPDLILIIGDRIEVFGCCICAFFRNIKTVHLGAGITNTIATYDDILRHNITLLADIELCEDLWSYSVVYDLYRTIKRKNYNIHIVGNLYLDDLPELNYDLVPKLPYDLVLINPETKGNSDIELFKQVDLIVKQNRSKSIWIPSNPDQHNFLIGKINFDYLTDLPRSHFLGLLSKCNRFITNSSSSYYEAPLYLNPEQIVRVGNRNLNRSTDFNEMQKYPNTADNIVKILKNYWINKQKGE